MDVAHSIEGITINNVSCSEKRACLGMSSAMCLAGVQEGM